MGQRETLPINHSTGSHVVHAAGGAAGGGIKGAIMGGLTGLVVGALALGAVGFAAAMFLTGTWTIAPIVTGAMEFVFSGPGLLTAALTGLGAVVGGQMGLFGGGALGGVVGGVSGATHGHEQVQRDRAAAQMVNAEVGAMQAQAAAMQAQAQITAQGQRAGDRYASASTMIQTQGTQLDAATAASQGMVGAPQLATARG
jgi:hypothetical protein